MYYVLVYSSYWASQQSRRHRPIARNAVPKRNVASTMLTSPFLTVAPPYSISNPLGHPQIPNLLNPQIPNLAHPDRLNPGSRSRSGCHIKRIIIIPEQQGLHAELPSLQTEQQSLHAELRHHNPDVASGATEPAWLAEIVGSLH